ncbi:MAG: SRPBCC domain-containing protein [Nanoarchaeota archaeon]|nr:SRPBCC domain-containing protein [Nanoarchaeota archaeon]
MKEIWTEIEINAPVSVVWNVLTDFLNYARWNPFIRRGTGTATVGSRLEFLIQPLGSNGIVFRPMVTRATVNEELRWVGHYRLPGLFDGEHVFLLGEIEQHRTRVVHRERLSGLLVPFLWKQYGKATERGFSAMNSALKEQVELVQKHKT